MSIESISNPLKMIRIKFCGNYSRYNQFRWKSKEFKVVLNRTFTKFNRGNARKMSNSAKPLPTPTWTSRLIRNKFIDFFSNNYNHTIVPSSSVIPLNDPTLKYVNSGMNQFKMLFLDQTPTGSWLNNLENAVNSQKCIRVGGKHNDLDDVGKDLYHHTFFEMLGNWSFNDYFKEEACSMAWELLTKEYCLPKKRLYVTYFSGDEKLNLKPDLECKEIWLKLGVSEDRILPFGSDCNFWEMGKCGPCGPCTEIHYDHLGDHATARSRVNAGKPDLIEIWNLVFIQFNRLENGTLELLRQRFVDTGMGLERLTAVLQNTMSNYDTDIFRPLFETIQKDGNIQPYSGSVGRDDLNGIDTGYRLLADHIRMMCIAIGDGVIIDASGQGQVLKRIIRRAVMYSKQNLGIKSSDLILSKLVNIVCDQLGDVYPELVNQKDHIKNVILLEEDHFIKTLERATILLKEIKLKSSDNVLQGLDAYILFRFHGLHEEFIELIANEYKMSVDWNSFNKIKEQNMKDQQTELNMKTNPAFISLLAHLKSKNIPPTDDSYKYSYNFVDGKYDFVPLKSQVLAILSGANLVKEAKIGDKVTIILGKTNFYSESGGQASDRGNLQLANLKCSINNTELVGDYIAHEGIIEKGILNVDSEVNLCIDAAHREGCMRNHTASHILNSALKHLASQSTQKSSNVTETSLKFDFSWQGELDIETVTQIESRVNEAIQNELTVDRRIISYQEALSDVNIVKLEREGYPETVSLITIMKDKDDYTSKELCCGTHVTNTSHLKKFVIVNQKPKGQMVRSIKALTGKDAEMTFLESKKIEELSNELKKAVLDSNSKKQICDFERYGEDLRNIRTRLMNETFSYQTQKKVWSELELLEPIIKRLINDYDKLNLKEEINREWQEIIRNRRNSNFICAELKSSGKNKTILKHLNELKFVKPTLIVFKNVSGKMVLAAWIPKDKYNVTAESWIKSATNSDQNMNTNSKSNLDYCNQILSDKNATFSLDLAEKFALNNFE